MIQPGKVWNHICGEARVWQSYSTVMGWNRQEISVGTGREDVKTMPAFLQAELQPLLIISLNAEWNISLAFIHFLWDTCYVPDTVQDHRQTKQTNRKKKNLKFSSPGEVHTTWKTGTGLAVWRVKPPLRGLLCPYPSAGLNLGNSVLFMFLASGRWWLKYLGPWYPCGRYRYNS